MKNNVSLKITALVIACFLIVGLCACSSCENTPDDVVSTEIGNISESEAPTEAEETEAATDAPVGINLYAVYTPSKAFDENGKEIPLGEAFGTGYTNYGGTLEFHEDKTFLISIGITKGDGVGTYSLTSGEEVTLKYNSGKTEIAEITAQSDGVATELSVPYGGFTVIFV